MMDFGNMFLEILPPLELGRAVAALEVPLVRVDHHVVLELVLVSQLLPADVTRMDGRVHVDRLDVVLERLVGAVRLSAIAFKGLVSSVHVFMHHAISIVEKGFPAKCANVRSAFSFDFMVTLDV